MVGWHHQFNGHKFEQTPGDSEGQLNQGELAGSLGMKERPSEVQGVWEESHI